LPLLFFFRVSFFDFASDELPLTSVERSPKKILCD